MKKERASEKTVSPQKIAKPILVAFAILCLVTAFLEYAPVIDEARRAFPETFGDACDCSCVLESRPWYGQINHRLWFWLISTPLIIFLANPAASGYFRAARSVFVVALSCAAIILAVLEAFEVVNAPFYHSEIWSDASAEDIFKSECFNSADGGPLAFSLLLGWIPAFVYAGWWEIIWYQYHKRKTRLIGKSFRRDGISGAVAFLAAAATAIFAGTMLGYWMPALH